jgi:hypothetical protein
MESAVKGLRYEFLEEGEPFPFARGKSRELRGLADTRQAAGEPPC